MGATAVVVIEAAEAGLDEVAPERPALTTVGTPATDVDLVGVGFLDGIGADAVDVSAHIREHLERNAAAA